MVILDKKVDKNWKEKILNILYTLNDKFVPQVSAGICSICENNKDFDEINFYLISDEIGRAHV